MKPSIAIMQPYIFPYIGYFNLIYESDIFVIYNDVQYIERGWINRNRIISREGHHDFTIPLRKSSSSKLISELHLVGKEIWLTKFLRMIEATYKKAPFFGSVYSLLEKLLNQHNGKLDELVYESICSIWEYIGLKQEIVLSSDIDYNRSVDKVEKIVSIASHFNAGTIIFPVGSKELYSKNMFESFETRVVEPTFSPHQQFKKNKFTQGLSVIDLLMFNSKEDIRFQFSQYSKSDLYESL